MSSSSSTDVRAWLTEIGKSQTWLAEQLGKSRQYVHQIASGGPASPEAAFAIEKLSGGRISGKDLLLRGADPLAACRAVAA